MHPTSKILSLKDKLQSYNMMSSSSKKYKVPFEPYDLTDVENLLNETEIDEYANSAGPRNHPSASEETIKRVLFMKKEVPFEEVDY